MPHILIAGKLHPSGLALLDQTPGITYDHVEEISETSYQPFLEQADAMVIRTQPMGAASVAKGARLQIVSRHGVGYDAVDVAALNARGIPLCIVGDVNSVSVAEHAMMQILACAKHLIRSDAAVRTGPWGWRNRLEQCEVSGKSLLIIGYGRIGRHLARMASGFGMKIMAYDPYLLTHGWPDGPAAAVADLATGLAAADFVSVHIPKADGPLIAAAELASMKRGAIIVNTARGGIVDEAALADALRSGHIAAAALDVFDAEPPSTDHPLLAFDQVILTPHTAGLTREAAERMAIASVQNVLDHFAGRLDPALIVNKDAIQ
ncbi:hydroxyacid dehydrogenase [Cypionkella sp.]|jgi:D-3-phosphoglycerate dehydrogenase|uniref:hydroxyacid dehydrogenase n=1 Tax=Cypionkella sp. TaxID=2811411 RepID=UPI00271BCAF3|nr:hydroxyacid dehydrogenase [Cypionkella sp.]MDO8984472.1 hydroxyacid dehydrogenase [Cypionkella sp.]MDP2049677.1 hydroxyacid dehydrogenase [Cypionkella sp.]